MTQQIVAHKTSDGKIFEDEAMANEHEICLSAARLLEEMFGTVDCPVRSVDSWAVRDWMLTNRLELISALNGLEFEEPSTEDDIELDGVEPHDNPDVESEDIIAELESETEARAELEAAIESGSVVVREGPAAADDVVLVVSPPSPYLAFRHVLDSDDPSDDIPF